MREGETFDWRLQADYGFEALITTEEVTAMIDQAREFLAHIEKFLLSYLRANYALITRA
jgi:uncharacterized protein (UPF0332 family)